MIADDADGTAAKTDRLRSTQKRRHNDGGVDRGIKQQIKVVIWKGLAAHLRNFRQAAAVGEENQKHGRLSHPRHFREQVCDSIYFLFFANNENVRLLKITLGRR